MPLPKSYGIAKGWSMGPGVVGVTALSIAGTPVLTGTRNVAYAGFQLVGTGGLLPYVFSIAAGALPAGLSLNAGTGVVSGTPTLAETQSGITIRCTDALGSVADLPAFQIIISSSVIASAGLPAEPTRTPWVIN